MVSFLPALGSHAKVKVTIMGQTSDSLYANSITAEANMSKLYKKVKHNKKVNLLSLLNLL